MTKKKTKKSNIQKLCITRDHRDSKRNTFSIKVGKLLYNPINFILGLGTQKEAYK